MKWYLLFGQEVREFPSFNACMNAAIPGCLFQGTILVDQLKDVVVSTGFLGTDHNRAGGAPLLFETMVFGGPRDGDTVRCSTYAEAVAQHARVVAENA